MADNESATEVIASSSGAAGATASASVAGVTLPGAVRERINGQLDGHTIVAWAEFDLDENNRFARQFAVLSETDLFILGAGAGGGEGAGTEGTPPALLPRPIAIK